MKHKINYKIRQLKSPRKLCDHDQRPGRKNCSKAQMRHQHKRQMFSQHYYITLFGHSWGTLSVRSRQCSLEEAVTSDNRNHFSPSKNYLQSRVVSQPFKSLPMQMLLFSQCIIRSVINTHNLLVFEQRRECFPLMGDLRVLLCPSQK